MKKYVALFDWDYTVQKGYAFKIWCNLLLDKGIIDKEFEIENDVILKKYKNGELNHDDLADTGPRILGKYIENISLENIESINEDFRKINDKLIYSLITNKVFPLLRKNNIEIIIISGSPQEAIDLYKNELKIDRIYAMKFDIENGKYLNKFKINTGLSSGKKEIINDILVDDIEILFAFGDSISDIPLLESAKYAFVNNSKNFFERENIFYLNFSSEEAENIIVEKITNCLTSLNNNI